MRIKSVTIKNFRQYKDVEVVFDRQKGKKDLHILYANNGVGKTNFLNAISWCLYEEETHLRNRSSMHFIPNSSVVDEIRKVRGSDQMEVSVSICIESSNEEITFTRSDTYKVSLEDVTSLGSRMDVLVYDGFSNRPIVDHEEQVQLIHKHLPHEISNFFFFDGEQLEEFFSETQSGNIKKGITELTQASYLQKASEYIINKYIKSELQPKVKEGGTEEISKLQDEIERSEEVIAHKEETIRIMQEQLKECERQIEDCNRIIHGMDSLSEKKQEHKTLEDKLQTLEKDIAEKKKEIKSFARESFVNLVLYKASMSLYEYIKDQSEKGHLPPQIDKKILKKILETSECPVCHSHHLTQESLDHVESLLQRITISSQTSAILNRTLSAQEAYFEKVKSYPSERDKIKSEYFKLEEESKQTELKYQKVENYLKSIVDADAITKAIDNRRTFMGTKDKLNQEIGGEKYQKELEEKSLLEKKNKLGSLLEKNDKLKGIKKQMEYLYSLVDIMAESKNEILTECRQAIRDQTYEIFSRLLWKKNAFSKVEIDEDYSLQVYNAFDEPVLGSCSAAETVLLALAFTLALQNVSKRDSLLFIDTPVGRVDLENRRNFMNVLLEVAKERQVILTFTPAEYSEGVAAILRPEYSSKFNLEINNQITGIK